MSAKFGPAGNSNSFKEMGYKHSLEVPEYLVKMELDHFEYQCGRGVNIGEETARKLGQKAAENGIRMSLHAPYFINLSNPDPERVAKNIDYIIQAARACDWMGGDRITVHCGGLSKMTRREALDNTLSTVRLALHHLEEQKLDHIILCIETMGKINVLGDFEEVMEICAIDERLLPCIDFGHLNSRTGGAVNSAEAFASLLRGMEDRLGRERARTFHGHFSKIEYSKGGEVRHLTFEDQIYGPDFDPLARLLAEGGFAPRFICESAGTQDVDAAEMKRMYEKYL